MSVSIVRRFVTVILLISFSTLTIAAQQLKPNPEEQPRKVKRELKKAYVDWIK